MADYFPSGFYNNMAQQLTDMNGHVELLNDKLYQRNANLREGMASTEKLARALNWLTGVAAFVALLGVALGAVELAHRW